jgi:hypothetical protein
MNFNLIKSKIAGLTYLSLVSRLINLLKDLEKESKPAGFWHPLILLKWSIEFAGTKSLTK